MWRKKWGKNKSTLEREALLNPPKKRWRPAGVKNKPKAICWPMREQAPLVKKSKSFNDYIDEVREISKDVEPYWELQNYDWIQFFNCTWHDVNVRGVGKIPPHTFLRIAENSYTKWYVDKVPVFETSYTTGLLPAKSPNKIYIVGQLVCIAAPDREDLYIPYRVNHIDKFCQWIIQNPFYKAIAKYKKEAGIK